jgi:glycosyltransferase involved in cell wall biosynthesis
LNSNPSNKKKLKILHILESYAPDYGGGAAVTTRDVCRFLAERGHEIRVLCTENKEHDAYAVRTDYDDRIRVDRINLPYFRSSDPDGFNLSKPEWQSHEERIARILNEYFDQWRPDIIDYHATRPLGEEALLTIGQRGIPLISTLHEGWLICPRLMFLQSPFSEPCSGPEKLKCLECLYSYYDGSRAKSLLKLPWRIVKLGSFPAYRLKRRRQASQKIEAAIARSDFMEIMHRPHLNGTVRHIPLGLDLTGLPDQRPARPRKPLRFGFIGGSQPNKGLLHILDSAVALKNEGLDFEIRVWGNSQETCEKEIKARNLEDRVFLGGTYQSHELWDVYNQMDVALMATLVSEPFGRVPIEAAAVGAITIAPAIGGITESIRDEIDGLTYRFREQKDLERQMRRILTEAGLYGRLQQNLRPVVHTRDAVAEVEEFYYELLATKT